MTQSPHHITTKPANTVCVEKKQTKTAALQDANSISVANLLLFVIKIGEQQGWAGSAADAELHRLAVPRGTRRYNVAASVSNKGEGETDLQRDGS